MVTTPERPPTARHGPPEIATPPQNMMKYSVSFAAVPGSPFHCNSGQPAASEIPPKTRATFWASGLGGRLPLESFLLVFGSTAKPWSEISDTIGLSRDHFESIGAAIEAHTQFLTWLIASLRRCNARRTPLQCTEDLDKLRKMKPVELSPQRLPRG